MKNLRALSVTIAILLSTDSAFADDYFDDASTISIVEVYAEADERCRGGSGDLNITYAWCGTRELLGKYLNTQRNFCYGKENEAGYQMKWHTCTKDSLRYPE